MPSLFYEPFDSCLPPGGFPLRSSLTIYLVSVFSMGTER